LLNITSWRHFVIEILSEQYGNFVLNDLFIVIKFIKNVKKFLNVPMVYLIF
jgi:hypothetical protein